MKCWGERLSCFSSFCIRPWLKRNLSQQELLEIDLNGVIWKSWWSGGSFELTSILEFWYINMYLWHNNFKDLIGKKIGHFKNINYVFSFLIDEVREVPYHSWKKDIFVSIYWKILYNYIYIYIFLFSRVFKWFNNEFQHYWCFCPISPSPIHMFCILMI